MRLRTLLAATVTSALAVGAISAPALATSVPSPAAAGALTTWGSTTSPLGGAAIPIPVDLTAPVVSVAASNRSTGVVTLDGHVRVWGGAGAAEAEQVPAGITDAAAISLAIGYGAVLHNDGRVTAWGADSPPVSEVPTDLRAKAVTVQNGTGIAVRTDGTLTNWGAAPSFTMPTGLTNLVDVSAANTHALALSADGTVTAWGSGPASVLPDFGGKKVAKITTNLSRSGVVFEDGTIAIWGAGTLPPNPPDFNGLTPATKVVSLGVWANAAAVTADGKVHAWGTNTDVAVVPSSLDGKPAAAVAMGQFHAAAIVTTFRDLTKPIVAGQPKVGQTLTATPATFSLTPDEQATGQWYAGEDAIEGATDTTLALSAAQLGKSISYRTTATRDEDTVTSDSEPVGPVTPATVASTTNLSVSPATGAVGTARTVTATVSSTGGNPTGTVTFTGVGGNVTQPLAGGKATWTLPATLAAGQHSITAAYSGDSNTDPSTSAALAVAVAKAGAKAKAKAKATGKTKKVAKKVTITVTVKTPNGVSPAGKVTVTLKGKTKKKVTVKVNAKGKATATFKKVKRGKYTATVKYAGNANVKAATGKAKFRA